MVQELFEQDGTWCMTQLGKHDLNVSAWLKNPRRMFKPRAHLLMSQPDVIELHAKLVDAGWLCSVLPAKANSSK